MNIDLVSKYLIYLRQSKNYTQENLANELGISRQAVSKWETANALPDLDMLLKISKLYNITVNQILEPQLKSKVKAFEEIIAIEETKLKSILEIFPVVDIIKASKGASPQVSTLLQKLFIDIDFGREREIIGSVKIDEIETIHSEIISMINISQPV